MTIEEQLVDLLTDDSAVAAAIDDRIYPVALYKKTTFPALTYRRLGGSSEFTLSGNKPWQTAVVGLAAWADNYPDARELAEAIRAVLNGYTATTPGDIAVATVEDGADEWLETMSVWGCTLRVTVQWEDN